ncbi:hypothetical protein BCR33DRAFT_712797 [Rhizoclosmatium globosum]|uniref:Uncharacterized protein n=1 Tax=Rhizoclosmatium globosum TaxID=329046 RepID=A0A1Y2CUU9_9FUNG|nr:hypothetical protein HDU99_002707 [Rhizoclosmatium hyalinum]KAJ3287670.1 hypothetical protein HDU79_005516 [Rhizoclosmatium sp. JEL0117]ORY50818.1 hypothetical protein BCR33DRAFT_712797 [Rhizoclosmatium globosum]|eukprot:ORY50818.1 hypothetical protein BCR33DRAFT_712797 [Rhizoclosmatium globosum]
MPHLEFNHQQQVLTITLSTAETFLALFGSISIPYSQIKAVRPLPGEAYSHFKSMGVYIPGVMTFATLHRTMNGKPEIYLYSSPLKTVGLDLQGHAHFEKVFIEVPEMQPSEVADLINIQCGLSNNDPLAFLKLAPSTA